MRLTLIQGGRSAANSIRPAKASIAPVAERPISGTRNALDELIREFDQLRVMWDDFKATYRSSVLGQSEQRRTRVLSMHKNNLVKGERA